MLKAIAKKYLPLAILFVLVVATLGMSRYAETRKKNHQDNTNHIQRGPTITPDKATESAKETDKTEDSPSWIETFTWPDGVTTWALLLTLFVIAWQSTETRDAAKAANSQIQMMMNKERARLRVELDSFDPKYNGYRAGYRVKATVSIFGSTEAYIERTVFFAGVMRPDESEIEILPAPMAEFPNTIHSGSDPLKTWTILFRTNPMRLWIPVENEEIYDVLNEESLMFCKGAIHYTDVFDGKWVFHFCRRYKVFRINSERIGGHWEDYGAPGKRRTKGKLGHHRRSE